MSIIIYNSLDAKIPIERIFPAATAAIYLKEVFAGNVYVNPDSEEETFILSLGQDERLNVIRKELPCKTQDVFLKNQKKKAHEYAIKITNKSSESIKVLLKDSIPVSTDKTIVVDASELSGGVINEENGVIDWEITVADHASEEIKLAYTITWYPANSVRYAAHPLNRL